MSTERDRELEYDKFRSMIALIFQAFWETYERQGRIRGFRETLPMMTRAWNLAFIETEPPVLALEYQTGPFNPAGYTFSVCWSEDTPSLSEVTTVEAAVKLAELGDVIDARFCEYLNVPFFSGYLSSEMVKFIGEWAVELAEQHIAETRPDFFQAKQRMTTLYSKLFELEHALREFVEKHLEAHFGKKWWQDSTIHETIRQQVAARKMEKRSAWVDDVDQSVLRFTDFPDLKIIINANKKVFRPALGQEFDPISWFMQSLKRLEPLRNRIGHVNTLSAKDERVFYDEANQVLKAIRFDPSQDR